MSETAISPLEQLAPSEAARPRSQAIWHASLAALAASLLCFVMIPTQADPDLWGHLRFGLDILRAHSLPAIDPYSFTQAGGAWINHEWLAELIFGLVWKAAGAAGLVLLKVALAVITGGLCFHYLLRAGVSTQRALGILLLLLPLMPQFNSVRPLLFTFPAFVLTIAILCDAERGRAQRLWLLPPLFAVWANLHGGFIAGLAILVLWAAAHAIFDRQPFRPVALPLAATFAATCINPYGWHLLAFLLRTASVPRPEIIEWAPLQASSTLGLMYLVVIGLSMVALIRSRLRQSWASRALLGAIAVLPFVALRHTGLAVAGIVVLAGPYIADLLEQFLPPGVSQMKRRAALPAWAPALPFACAAVLLGAALSRPLRINVDTNYPVDAVKLLETSGVGGNVANGFNWGEYLIWHLGPRVKVMMDGRRETVYTEEVYRQHLNFHTATGDWTLLLRQYRPDVALLGKDSPAANLLRLDPVWAQLYQDETTVILARKGSAAADQIAHAAPTFVAPVGPHYFP
jgi:hypothetical protein